MNETLVATDTELGQSGESSAPTATAVDRIFAGDLNEKALQSLVDSWKETAQFAILECIDDLQFPRPTEAISVNNWPKGRIFQEAFELRWEKLEEKFRVVFSSSELASQEKLPGLDGIKDQVPRCSKTTATYYLWDETNTRLGHKLGYQCVTKTEKQNVLLQVREYRDARGRLKFWRYLKMEPEQNGSKSL